MDHEFKAGDVVLFKKGGHYELGIVKRKCEDGGYFVLYNIGDTAAKTRAEDLREISNSYAFKVERANEVQEGTNREWLSKMTDEELAKWLSRIQDEASCIRDASKYAYEWLEWLKEENDDSPCRQE